MSVLALTHFLFSAFQVFNMLNQDAGKVTYQDIGGLNDQVHSRSCVPLKLGHWFVLGMTSQAVLLAETSPNSLHFIVRHRFVSCVR